ncbi:hypothetical protein [Micromonospora maritima]|uniref:hypothetical protein n=1 Tax=Micromonospora maritima TaxID=986711 RepID=UPI00157BCD83|nr:hypothetical protein [Micromonospora maritima]
MTSSDSTRESTPEGRTVEGDQLCGAPGCRRTLAEHMPDNGNNGRVIDVRGVIVGSAACAWALVNACPACGATGQHSCYRNGAEAMANVKTQLVFPAPSTTAVAR